MKQLNMIGCMDWCTKREVSKTFQINTNDIYVHNSTLISMVITYTIWYNTMNQSTLHGILFVHHCIFFSRWCI